MELLSMPTSSCRLPPRCPPGIRRRRQQRLSSAGTRCSAIADPSGAPAPMGQKTEYRDGPLEKAFMGLFARKMEKFASGEVADKRSLWDWDYESFVDVSRRVMTGRSRNQQQQVVREVLLSMLPPGAPAQFRKLFPPTKWAAEFNAALTVPFFNWLVGPSEVVEVEVNGVKQRSGVHIKKCRYLENSGCVGQCVNMCKIPTQDFFTNEFGLPLTMTPSSATVPSHGGADPLQASSPTTSSEDEEMARDMKKIFYSILKTKLPKILSRNASFAPVRALAEGQAGLLRSIPGYEAQGDALMKTLDDLERHVAELQEVNRRSPTTLFQEEDAALVAAVAEEEASFQAQRDLLAQKISELTDQHSQFVSASNARQALRNKLASEIVEKHTQITRIQREIAQIESALRTATAEEADYTAQAGMMQSSLEELRSQQAQLEEGHAAMIPLMDETARQEEARRRATAKSEAKVASLRDTINQLCTP